MLVIHRKQVARRGMTLIELIIVLTILAVLATLVVVYVVPVFQDNKNVVRASDRVTTALLIAKQWALRDQAPRGVRFLVDTTQPTSQLVVQGLAPQQFILQQMQYIELPDPIVGQSIPLNPAPNFLLVGGQVLTNGTGAGATSLIFQNVDFLGGADTGNTSEGVVQPGDYFSTGGANYLIGGVPASNQLTLANTVLGYPQNHGLTGAIPPVPNPSSPPPGYVYTSGAWQIIRQSRPITGEALLNLPQNIAIDLTWAAVAPNGTQVPQRPITGAFEIIFGPSGNVINFQGSSPAIAFVIRDITMLDPAPAGYSLDPNYARVLGVNPRTGMVAGQAVAPNSYPGGPLGFALDGKSSGL
jgi:prepilin-type N-terminal cleavage/methylation domain-containing protein